MDRPSTSKPANADRRAALILRRRRKMAITNRLRWSYLLSSTLPILLVGALLITTLLQSQQRNAYASQQAIANQIAGNISTFLYDIEQQLLRVSGDLRPDIEASLLQDTARRIVDSSPDMRALIVTNQTSRQVVNVTNELLEAEGITAQPTDTALLRAASEAGQGGRTGIRLASDQTPYFQIVLPIRDPELGTLLGSISVEVSAVRITQMLRSAAQSDATAQQADSKVAYLIDGSRQVMLSDGTSSWTPPADLSVLFDEARMVGEYWGGSGDKMVGARGVVSPVTPMSWSVIVEQPSIDFFGEVYQSVLLLTVVVLTGGVIALAWAFFQGQLIIRPIRALRVGAQALGAGQLNHQIVVHSGDELETLADTFNNMAAQLQGSLQKIAQQNEHLRHGLELARDIQMGLLPNTPPWQTELLSVHARSLPASEVGGDFYTYMALPNGQAAVAIGDISGKGVGAALLMALTSSALESQARSAEHPGAMLAALHQALRPRLQANQMNAALLIAIYDANLGVMTIANAGMIAPLLVQSLPDGTSRCSFVEVGGLPIGTALPARYPEVQVRLSSTDTLIFLSDGIVEAHNLAGELYGFERLEALVSAMPSQLSIVEIVQHILDEVLHFTEGAEPHDDITLLVTRPTISSPTRLADTPVDTDASPVSFV